MNKNKIRDEIERLNNEIIDLENYANGQIKYNNADPLDDEMVDINEKITAHQNKIDDLTTLLIESE